MAFDGLPSLDPFELHLPTLHFLEYLSSKQQGHGILWKEVLQDLASFGYSEALLRSVLDRTLSTGSAPSMVLLDRKVERGGNGRIESVNMNAEVEILPRGRLFATRLSSTCEFVFWCAFDAAEKGTFVHRKLKSRVGVDAREVRKDHEMSRATSKLALFALVLGTLRNFADLVTPVALGLYAAMAA